MTTHRSLADTSAVLRVVWPVLLCCSMLGGTAAGMFAFWPEAEATSPPTLHDLADRAHELTLDLEARVDRHGLEAVRAEFESLDRPGRATLETLATRHTAAESNDGRQPGR